MLNNIRIIYVTFVLIVKYNDFTVASKKYLTQIPPQTTQSVSLQSTPDIATINKGMIQSSQTSQIQPPHNYGRHRTTPKLFPQQ